MMDYSSVSLMQFLDYAADKGLMNKETARSKKVSVSAILEILDENEKSDVRELDVDDIIQRFANLEGQKFTPSSLSVYKSRFNSSIRDFVRYRDNPLSYTAAKSKPKKLKLKKKKDKSTSTATSSVTTPHPQQRTITNSGINNSTAAFESHVFPIPIRDGLTVRIAGLPHDLSAAEAKRIAAVVTALAIED